MADFRNGFPRGSKEPAQDPLSQNSKASEGKEGDSVLDGYGGGGTGGPLLRGMEVNTADGRASRTATFSPEDTSTGDVGNSSEHNASLVDDVSPYGGQAVGTNSQGGMPRDLPGGPSGLDFDS